MKLFFDRNCVVRTARMLSIFEWPSGHHVRHHDDDPRFTRTSRDAEILTALHDEAPDWVFVGGDGKILRNKAELAVLAETDLNYLVLNHVWCNKRIEETCWMLIKGWPKILAEIERLRVHSILELKFSTAGNVENLGPTASFRPRRG